MGFQIHSSSFSVIICWEFSRYCSVFSQGSGSSSLRSISLLSKNCFTVKRGSRGAFSLFHNGPLGVQFPYQKEHLPLPINTLEELATALEIFCILFQLVVWALEDGDKEFMKKDHMPIPVFIFHHNFAEKTSTTSLKFLKPKPFSSVGKVTFLQDLQWYFFHSQ